ncbi:MAG: SDR family oxidoreductase, partial [Candidatus Eiseniibacteriota bacterium]
LNGINAHKYSADYNAAKEAIRALTRTAAVEWGRHNILCNCIAPAEVTLGTVFRGTSWFLIVELIVLVMIVALPGLATYLPARMH